MTSAAPLVVKAKRMTFRERWKSSFLFVFPEFAETWLGLDGFRWWRRFVGGKWERWVLDHPCTGSAWFHVAEWTIVTGRHPGGLCRGTPLCEEDGFVRGHASRCPSCRRFDDHHRWIPHPHIERCRCLEYKLDELEAMKRDLNSYRTAEREYAEARYARIMKGEPKPSFDDVPNRRVPD